MYEALLLVSENLSGFFNRVLVSSLAFIETYFGFSFYRVKPEIALIAKPEVELPPSPIENHNFNNPAEVHAFLAQVNEVVVKHEAEAEQILPDHSVWLKSHTWSDWLRSLKIPVLMSRSFGVDWR